MYRLLITALLMVTVPVPGITAETPRPNIVVILADDLGYGDVKWLNPAGKIPTPNLDRLAAEGLTCTDAHSGSAVCTPTRYGILTGRYCWRSPLKSGVLFGYSPRLIEPGRVTIAELLKQQGYHTACIGKWHLGMDWPLRDGGVAKNDADGWKVDYSRPIVNGPNAVGFEYYFGISASLDMPPYIWIENDRTVGLPTVEKKWIRKGPAHADFEAVDVLPELGRRSASYIAERAKMKQPFFLYLPLNSPHTPILPTKAWQGKTGLNSYADFVAQTDAVVGSVLKALADHGQAEHTLVIFTSDNGCSPQANFPELLQLGHNPSHLFRGHKADIFDGGHRVPFLVRWPGVIPAKSTTSQLVCLTDIYRTAATTAGATVPDSAGEDSFDIGPLFKQPNGPAIRDSVIHHSINGSFAIREPRWKLALCPGSGGWSPPRPGRDEVRSLPPVQLYDFEMEKGEQKNMAEKQPDLVKQLTAKLEHLASSGRSFPGPASANTNPVNIYKAGQDSQRSPKKN